MVERHTRSSSFKAVLSLSALMTYREEFALFVRATFIRDFLLHLVSGASLVDDLSQHQCLRGGIFTELLKGKQFVHAVAFAPIVPTLEFAQQLYFSIFRIACHGDLRTFV